MSMRSDIFTTADIVRFAGMTITLVCGAHTQSAPFTVADLSVVQHGGAPLHRSLEEAKVFVLLEGQLDFTLGTVTHALQPGASAHVAPGEIHGFVNTAPTLARLLLVSTPPRHDAFFRAMAALPLPHDPVDVRRICDAYAQEIVGL